MRTKRSFARVAAVVLFCAAASFTFTGVAQSAVSNAPYFGAAFFDALQSTAALSVSLTLPRVDINEQKGEESQPRQEQDQTESLPIPEESAVQNETASSVETVLSEAGSDSDESEPYSEEQLEVESDVPVGTLLISENITSEFEDLGSLYADSDGLIKEVTYKAISGPSAIDLDYGQIRNCTELTDGQVFEIASRSPAIKLSADSQPQVLIMHTHTTEGYEPTDDGCYDSDFNGRTLDPSYSVVGAGAVIAGVLAENGIGVIHDGTVHDDPVYSNSYSRSNERVKEILERYPSIKVVLDIHRDGIAEGDVRIAPVCEIDGQEAAQVMMICGCDDGSGILPSYEDNLSFAAFVQTTAERMYPGLTRPLLFDYRYYNQDLADASILVEIGALGNTPAQAKKGAELFSKALSASLEELCR